MRTLRARKIRAARVNYALFIDAQARERITLHHLRMRRNDSTSMLIILPPVCLIVFSALFHAVHHIPLDHLLDGDGPHHLKESANLWHKSWEQAGQPSSGSLYDMKQNSNIPFVN